MDISLLPSCGRKPTTVVDRRQATIEESLALSGTLAAAAAAATTTVPDRLGRKFVRVNLVVANPLAFCIEEAQRLREQARFGTVGRHPALQNK
jgi:hypothetical protein